MFKRKPIYVAGLLLFVLVLLAALAARFLIPGPGGWEAFEEIDPEFTQGPVRDDFQLSRGMEILFQTVSFLRAFFWPVAVLCLLGIGLCSFMLIRISRREAREEEEEIPDRGGNGWLTLITVFVVIAVAVTGMPSATLGTAMEAQTEIRQDTAKNRDIPTLFSGSGTLESSEPEKLELPAGVKLLGYTVKNGQTVAQGDVLARVDQNSVQRTMQKLQALLDELDEELAESREYTISKNLKAGAKGRVMVIYAQEGQAVADVMREHGALVLLSLDGSVKVELETTAQLRVGETVKLVLEDGTELEAKVRQGQDGCITVTRSDKNMEPGTPVTVTTQEGLTLGSGVIEVSSPLRITGYTGTVEDLRVKTGQKVDAGDTLLRLTDTADLSRYGTLLNQREELVSRLAQLTVVAREGTVLADRSGIVTGIPADAAYLPDPQQAQPEVVQQSFGASGGWGLVLLSNVVTTEPSTEPPTEPPAEPSVPVEPTAPPETQTVYAGKVIQVSYGALTIQICEAPVTGMDLPGLAAMDEALFTTPRLYAPELTVSVYQYVNGVRVPGAVQQLESGARVLLTMTGDTVTQIEFIPAAAEIPGQGGTGNLPGGSMGGWSGQFPSGGGSWGGQIPSVEPEPEDPVYAVELEAVCSITPAEVMTVDVTVDELDILTLMPGQTAQITLDALPGQQFQGVVQKLHTAGVNNGGNTKYTVTLEVPRLENMLEGMNTSVKIEVGRLEQVLTVPAAAVQEDGTRTFVYTALDPETGEPVHPVDVKTGATDGVWIQILGGLQDGTAVYYRYAESVTYTNTQE